MTRPAQYTDVLRRRVAAQTVATRMYADLIAALDAPMEPVAGELRALCLVQLAHVDEINVAVGHRAMDELAAEFAARIGRFARAGDAVIQVQPHRFAVVVTGLKHRHHLTLAMAKLERLFEAPADVGGKPVKLHIHVGVALTGMAAECGDDHGHVVLRNAQRALIRSTEQGAPVVADELAHVPAVMDWTYLGRLAAAIDQDEFVPHFQPVVSGVDERLVGAELLLRWSSTENGLIMPDRFIPLAERADLIRPITWFALKAGIAQAARWPQTVSVSVNTAAAALDDHEIVHVIGDALAVFGFEPKRLVVEVTESGIMRNRKTAFEVLGALRAMGVRVSIDDFGTGYSSFAHFRDIPADELKIDRSFVANMRRAVDEQLVRSIIELAHNLGLRVVGEGIEDRWTAEHLKFLGCDLLQGFLFGKAVPVNAFLRHFPALAAAREETGVGQVT